VLVPLGDDEPRGVTTPVQLGAAPRRSGGGEGA
jgi:hypothetical protein